VNGQQHEPNRVLGFPVGPRPPRPPRPGREGARRAAGPAGPAGPAVRREGEEPQRVLGFPVDLFSRATLDRLRDLIRAVADRRR
jgi:hypothetical protein